MNIITLRKGYFPFAKLGLGTQRYNPREDISKRIKLCEKKVDRSLSASISISNINNDKNKTCYVKQTNNEKINETVSQSFSFDKAKLYRKSADITHIGKNSLTLYDMFQKNNSTKHSRKKHNVIALCNNNSSSKFSKDKKWKSMDDNTNNKHKEIAVNHMTHKNKQCIKASNNKYNNLIKVVERSIKESQSVGSVINFERNSERKTPKKLPNVSKELSELVQLETSKLKECDNSFISVYDEKKRMHVVLNKGHADLMYFCDLHNRLKDSTFYTRRKQLVESYYTKQKAADIMPQREEKKKFTIKKEKLKLFLQKQLYIHQSSLDLTHKKNMLLQKIKAANMYKN